MSEAPTQDGSRGEPEAGESAVKRRIVDFISRASLEVTLPTAAEIEAIAAAMPRGAEIFLSDIPRRSPRDAVAICARLSAAELAPVPHVAVRGIESVEALEKLLGECVETGGARTVLLIAGDYTRPAGPFADTEAALRSGALARLAIGEVAVAGYPEGHPHIPTERLDQTLAAKLSLVEALGARPRIVTQFGFDPAAIARWVSDKRRGGTTCPIDLGMAGPASIATLMKFAMRCGVRTAGRGLVGSGARISRAVTQAGPERMVEPLASLAGKADAGPLRPHFFSFGGALRTAAWVDAVRQGRFALGPQGMVVDIDRGRLRIPAN